MQLLDHLLGKNSARTQSPKRFRQVGFDQLEARELLTTASVEPVVQATLSDFMQSDMPKLIGPQPLVVSEWEDLATFGPVEFTPLEAPTTSEYTPTEGEFTESNFSGGGDSEWEDQSSPPWIYDLDWYSEFGIYTFTGYVIDDGDPFELTIHFGGLLDGATGWVNYDGTFSFSIQLDDPMGVVTATVVDGEGLWSNQAMVYV